MKGLKAVINFLTDRTLYFFEAIGHTLKGIIFGSKATRLNAPYMVDHIEIKRYMSVAILAVLPTTVAAVVFYGWYALLVILISYAAGGIVEVAFAVIRKREIEEGFLVTGLIYPLLLPPTIPLWVAAVGIVFGTFFGKEVFGGTGRNIFNPALVGRLFITIAFPGMMSTAWQQPFSDAITAATPLSLFKGEGLLTANWDLLFGQVPGSMGELFRIGIILGGIFLMLTRVSNWRVPVFYLGSVAAFAFLGNLLLPLRIAPPLFQLLTGGLLFGAMFMATDPVTSPFTNPGKILFGIFCGLLTVLIRSFSGYTEGVMFSIIIMNALTPLIDRIILSRKYRTDTR